MNKFGFQWPESLECGRYPEAGAGGELCVGENNTSSGSGPASGGNDGYRHPYKPGNNNQAHTYSGVKTIHVQTLVARNAITAFSIIFEVV